MITVRIAHAEYRPGMTRAGTLRADRVLVVLADDAGGRAADLAAVDGRLFDPGAARPAGRVGRDGPGPGGTGQPAAARGRGYRDRGRHRRAGPETTAARIELDTPSGPRQVMGRLADGLALAAAVGAPVRVADPVMDQLAVQVHGDDLLGPFLEREPAAAEYHVPRRTSRNLAFTDGLDGWQLHGNFLRDASGSHWHDYSCTTEGQAAMLSSAVPHRFGSAQLSQQIRADHYRGRTVVFRGELRAEDIAGQARLYLRVHTEQPARASHAQRHRRGQPRLGRPRGHGIGPRGRRLRPVRCHPQRPRPDRAAQREPQPPARSGQPCPEPSLLVTEAVLVRWLAASGR
jgi:hypothetical protein